MCPANEETEAHVCAPNIGTTSRDVQRAESLVSLLSRKYEKHDLGLLFEIGKYPSPDAVLLSCALQLAK